jgi:hypothetical protein
MNTPLFLSALVAPVWLAMAGEPAPLHARAPDAPLGPNEFVRLKEANRGRDFPTLAYWGVGNLEWGSPRKAIQVAGSPPPKPITVGNDPFVTELQFDEKTDRLLAVTYEAKPLPATDSARREEFDRVYQFLINRYREPSAVRLDRRAARTRNAAGQTSQTGRLFLADWSGMTTVLTLDFADDHLLMRFAQAPSFNPAAIQELLGKNSGTTVR